MKLYLISIILATFALYAAEDAGALSSKSASYDGNALLLKGQVVLDHGLGKMHAEEAVLQKQVAGSDFPFSFIDLKNKVHLLLLNGSELICENANFDFGQLKGRISSEEDIIYKDRLKNKKASPSFLTLKGKKADLSFSQIETLHHKTVYHISSLDMYDQVHVEYDKGYILTSDHALYQEKGAEKKIYISALDKKKCTLLHDKDTIYAEDMLLDIAHSSLEMTHPQGSLQTSLVKDKDACTTFSAKKMIWDHLINQISFLGPVTFQDPTLGLISSDKEIQLIQKEGQISSLKAFGKTSIIYLGQHKLTSYGTFFIDQQQKTAVLESSPNHQIQYEENNLIISSDKGRMEYAENNHIFEPISMTMQGHIQITSKDPSLPQKYGVADRAHYLHGTETLILFADPGKKVLFINEEDNLYLSAQEVHITKDRETKKQSIKGIGNVQLSLSSEEELQLKKLFKS